MTLLGGILLDYYAAASTYADQAIVAAVEELEKHADAQPDLVARVELAMIEAGNVGIPWEKVDEFMQVMRQMKEDAR